LKSFSFPSQFAYRNEIKILSASLRETVLIDSLQRVVHMLEVIDLVTSIFLKISEVQKSSWTVSIFWCSWTETKHEHLVNKWI